MSLDPSSRTLRKLLDSAPDGIPVITNAVRNEIISERKVFWAEYEKRLKVLQDIEENDPNAEPWSDPEEWAKAMNRKDRNTDADEDCYNDASFLSNDSVTDDESNTEDIQTSPESTLDKLESIEDENDISDGDSQQSSNSRQSNASHQSLNSRLSVTTIQSTFAERSISSSEFQQSSTSGQTILAHDTSSNLDDGEEYCYVVNMDRLGEVSASLADNSVVLHESVLEVAFKSSMPGRISRIDPTMQSLTCTKCHQDTNLPENWSICSNYEELCSRHLCGDCLMSESGHAECEVPNCQICIRLAGQICYRGLIAEQFITGKLMIQSFCDDDQMLSDVNQANDVLNETEYSVTHTLNQLAMTSKKDVSNLSETAQYPSELLAAKKKRFVLKPQTVKTVEETAQNRRNSTASGSRVEETTVESVDRPQNVEQEFTPENKQVKKSSLYNAEVEPSMKRLKAKPKKQSTSIRSSII